METKNGEQLSQNMVTTSKSSLNAFKAISDFVIELGKMFSKKHKPLSLYCRLITKTRILDTKPVEKHISAFRNFCESNRTAIESKNYEVFVVRRISYSEKVYIDMFNVFKHADKETRDTIWIHLLTLCALLDPVGNAKSLLKTAQQSLDYTRSESPGTGDMLQTLLSSGVMGNLINSMGTGGTTDGTPPDLSGIVGLVDGLMSNINPDEIGEDGVKMLDSIQPFIGMLKQIVGGTNQTTPEVENSS